jgi:Macrocin-O-methyltransferase (TylF)
MPTKRKIAREADINSPKDFNTRMSLLELLRKCPIPDTEFLSNVGLFLDRRILSRFLFINEMYQRILGIHGCVMELGVRYGQNLSLFTSLRGIYEPFNHNRKIIGFDTFEGFPVVDKTKDMKDVKTGEFSVPERYEQFLSTVLKVHENMAPIESIKKFDLVKGDASKTVKKYLDEHSETIIALAYFDFDLYIPTKDCLEAIVPYLSKGAVIGFDEINVPGWPGETAALREVLGTNSFTIRHSGFRAEAGYLVYGE